MKRCGNSTCGLPPSRCKTAVGASQVKVPKLRDSKGHVAVVGGLGIHRVEIHIYILQFDLPPRSRHCSFKS